MSSAAVSDAPDAWLEVSVVAGTAAADEVAEALRPFAHGGVVQEQYGDPDDLAPYALLPDVHVKIYLPAAADSPEFRRQIENALAAAAAVTDLGPVGAPGFVHLAEEDWANAWKAHYEPFRIGRRLWVAPSWRTEPDGRRPDDVVLTLDPGMAFGTGLHQSTQLCLEALETAVRPGVRLLDVGTGSGILAVAAAKLGAAAVLATDNDPRAVATAVTNAAANGVADRVEVLAGTLPSTGRWEIVVVNILAPVIERLLVDEGLLSFVGERLILSGIVRAQEAGVRTAVVEAGGVVEEVRYRGDWLCFWVRPQKMVKLVNG